MTMKENLDHLKKLIHYRYGKQVCFYSLPKEKEAAELINDEMAMSLIQNKKMRHYFKACDLVVPIYRGVVLDGAVIIQDAEDLSLVKRVQLTELVELLVTDILSLEDEALTLKQTEQQLDRQLTSNHAFYSESLLSDIIH